MKEIISQLNQWQLAYDEGNPLVSDKEYDNLYFELEKLEKETGIVLPDSPTSTITYQVVNQLKKVEHNHPMLSAAKTKDWQEFLNYFGNEDVIGMVKLDGLTLSLTYENGVLKQAETRGNGVVGEDVYHNALVIPTIPKKINYTDELIIDGEIICRTQDFEPFAADYKNPRNFASGSIRLLDSAECAKRNLTFVAWHVVKGLTDNVITNFNELQQLGFIVVPWTSSFDWDAKEFLIDQAKSCGYPCDGLIGRFADRGYGDSLGSTEHHTKAIYAFKFYDEEYESRLKYIEWSLGRTGVLTPIAVFEPIEIDGTTVERASLHNYSVMKEIMGDCCYCGQAVTIYKANMIIPQVKSAVKLSYGEVIAAGGVTCDGFGDDYGVLCPACGGETRLETSDSGTINLVCDNPQCEGKLINRLDHFCSKKGLDIKGLSKATLEKLMNWEWVTSLTDLFTLQNHFNDWCLKPGFGEKSVNKILDAINNAHRTTLDKVICAAGIPLIGATIAKQLANLFSTWDDFRYAIDTNFDFTSLDGFGPEMNYALHSFNYTEIDEIVNTYLTFEDTTIAAPATTSLSDKIFVITGKLQSFKNRDELKTLIEARGGKVSDSVSAKTSYLINNDIESQSAKNKKAKNLGIEIITEDTFKQLFDF